MFSKFLKNKKTIVLGAVLMTSVLSSNYFAAGTKSDSSEPEATERRFLGTGTKVEKTECFEGTQVVITTVTVFWIQVGESTREVVAC